MNNGDGSSENLISNCDHHKLCLSVCRVNKEKEKRAVFKGIGMLS